MGADPVPAMLAQFGKEVARERLSSPPGDRIEEAGRTLKKEGKQAPTVNKATDASEQLRGNRTITWGWKQKVPQMNLIEKENSDEGDGFQNLLIEIRKDKTLKLM